MKRTAIGVGIAAAVVAGLLGAGWGWLQLAPRRVPAGQPALSTIHPDAVDDFRRDFDAAADGVRLLVLLSPT